MKYIEKDFEFVEIENEGFAGDYIKMPTFVGKLWMKSNVKKLRSMMGGVSKDISTRPIDIEDKNIKGYKNDIRIRVYKPEDDVKRPVMIFIHGGGWFAGSIDAVHDYCKAVSDRADIVVISVDYGLAPENPYPTGLEECYEEIKWSFENKDDLNIDTDNIIVSGDSAGGNYSAILSIMARDRKDFNISKQILLYPATDMKSMEDDNGDKMAKIFSEVVLEWYLKKKVKTT
ncbi:MAG: alpha/beta hydrolase, partial [Peptostreptococcaceae bacterium]